MRRLIGYDRYDSKAALEVLNRVYDLTRLYVNFFQPDMKLVHKSRHGARVHKVYDTAQTPYRRLLSAGILTEVKQQELWRQCTIASSQPCSVGKSTRT